VGALISGVLFNGGIFLLIPLAFACYRYQLPWETICFALGPPSLLASQVGARGPLSCWPSPIAAARRLPGSPEKLLSRLFISQAMCHENISKRPERVCRHDGRRFWRSSGVARSPTTPSRPPSPGCSRCCWRAPPWDARPGWQRSRGRGTRARAMWRWRWASYGSSSAVSTASACSEGGA
jgi:hypothetical protein